MRRLPLILAGLLVIAVLGVLSSIVTQGFSEMRAAEEELRQLNQEKRRLEARIGELRETLHALENNPEAVESLARRELGWVRPGERVLIIATPTPPPRPESLTHPEPTPILSLPE